MTEKMVQNLVQFMPPGKGSMCTIILEEENNYYEDTGPGSITLILVVWKSCTHSPGRNFKETTAAIL